MGPAFSLNCYPRAMQFPTSDVAEQRKGQARGPAPGQQEPQGLTHIPRPAPTKGRPDASMSKALTAKLQNNPHGDQSVPGEERLQPRGRSRSGA